MPTLKSKFKNIKMVHLQICGVVLLIALAAAFLWSGNRNSMQALPAMLGDVYFEGTYQIEGGEPRPIVAGEHIPTTQGDVTLRGNFHMLAPDGTYEGIYRGEIPIAFYTNHINLTFVEGADGAWVTDSENPIFGDAACGAHWTAYVLTSPSDSLVEIIVHNPHGFGNETAIDEMLDSVALWAGIDFEKGILESGATERNIGLFFVIISIMILGIALFSTLIHIKNSKVMNS